MDPVSLYQVTLHQRGSYHDKYINGFNLSEMEKSCVCEPRLTLYTGEHKCTITNRVENVIKFWVGMMTNLMD